MSLTNEARSRPAFEHAGAILKRTHDDLLISKQKLRKIEAIELVRLNREQGQQNLGFTSRPFVLCGLPLRRPSNGTLTYERRNGHFKLQITGHPEFGLPYGQDRLIPIFLATLAVRQQSQTVRFKSGATILEMFGMGKGGKEYRRIVAAFERVFGATIFFGSETSDGCNRVVHRARFNFMKQARIWYEGGANDENVVVLSEEFYEEVLAHPIPCDMDAIKLLAASPGALDLFLWLSYRTFTAKSRASIPLFGPAGLVSQLGCIEYSRPRRFRAKLAEWIHEVRMIWPDCPAVLEANNMTIAPYGRMTNFVPTRS